MKKSLLFSEEDSEDLIDCDKQVTVKRFHLIAVLIIISVH